MVEDLQNVQTEMLETFTSSPITSIKFISKFRVLLIANSDTVFSYNFNSRNHLELISKFKIFKTNKIHGIDFNLNDNAVLFFGGRSFSLIDINLLLTPSNKEIGNLTSHQSALNDWIISGCFDYYCNSFYLLNAHNIVTSINYGPVENSPLSKHTTRIPLEVNDVIDCNEKSILYSGSLKVLDSRVVVFSGTVMSGIYVWQFSKNKKSTANHQKGEIINHLTEHEGSIFNVKCNKDATISVSCSDDRSIKVWDLKNDSLLTTSFGHGSRIWDLEIFKESISENGVDFYLISTSEDLTCRLWKYDAQLQTMDCIKVLESHQGKNVWCSDVFDDRFVVSGGNDGRVRLYDLENHTSLANNNRNNCFEVTLDSLISLVKSQGHLEKLFKNENVKEIITGENGRSMLVITSFGKMFLIDDIENFNNQNVKLIEQPIVPHDLDEIKRIDFEKSEIENEKNEITKQIEEILKADEESGSKKLKKLRLKKLQIEEREMLPKQTKYSFINNYFNITRVDNSGDSKYFDLFMTNSSGYQIIYRFNRDDLKLIITRQIKNIFNNKIPISQFSKVSNVFNFSNKEFIFESPNPENPLILASFNDEKTHFENIRFLSKPKTKFVISCIAYSNKHHSLVICSRYATFSIYDITSSTSEKIDMKFIDPIQTWKKIIPGDTISEAKILFQADKFFIMSILLRDGDYLYLKIFCNESNKDKLDIIQGMSELLLSKLKIEILQSNRISKGGFLEGLFFNYGCEQNQDLLFYGFKLNYFYLYNETKNFEIWSELCGGSHRLWRFAVMKHKSNINKNDFEFIYVKDNHIILKRFKLEYLILEGSHGKEIRDLSCNSNIDNIIVTGGEDNTLKINKFAKDSTGKINNLETLWTIRKHVSGLQKVKFISDDMFISCAAREEFYVWKTNEILDTANDQASSKLFVNCVDELAPSVSDNHDLRIMDFDYLPVFINGKIVSYLLSLVYSNSQIKVFDYNFERKLFLPLAGEKYKQNCLLNTKFLVLENMLYLLISGTDGYISIYKLSDSWGNGLGALPFNFQLVINEKIHQNGIKCLEFFKFENENMLGYDIISGGDDNGLAVFKFGRAKNADVEDSEFGKLEYFVNNAASSTITSISKLHNNKIFVVSIDQILRIWEIQRNVNNNAALKLISEHYTTIADTGCGLIHAVNQNNYAIVGGVGLSIIEI